MSLIGETLSAGASIYGAHKSASTAKKIAQQQINWERERALNAHQWEVQDFINAGLNPILSAGGTGANTSSITPPMPDTSGYTSAGQAIQKGIDQKIAQQNADTAEEIGKSEILKNESIKNKNDIEAGTKPMEVAIAQQKADAITKKFDAEVNRIKTLLPTEYQNQIQELALKAYQNRLNSRELEVLNRTGLTLNEWKALGAQGLDIVKSALKKPSVNIGNSTSAKKTLKRNSKGQFYWD